jgi:TctA family transporter
MKGAGYVLRIPRRILMPCILMFCIVGAFAINNSVFGIVVMLTFGILGFIMEENDIPVAPCILGIVLGRMLEENFVTSMIKSNGSFAGFFDRPIAGVLGVATILVWFLPLLMMLWSRRGGRPHTAA